MTWTSGWSFTTHHWFLLYIVGLLVLIYRPPKALQGAGSFITQHFGDSIGVYLLHLGIGLLVLGGWYSQLQSLTQVGQSLISVSLAVLKLTKDAVPNGKPPVPIVEQPKPPEVKP